MLLVFSVGYVEMARRVTSAGGFYSFVSHGFGQAAGLATAAVVTVSYAVLVAALVGVFGYFAATSIADWTGPRSRSPCCSSASSWSMCCSSGSTSAITARVLAVFFISEIARGCSCSRW